VAESAQVSGVVLEERAGLAPAMLLVAPGSSAAFADRVAARFGVMLPESARRVTGERVEFAWAGPGRWLALTDEVGAEEWVGRLSEACAGSAAVSTQGSAQVIVRIRGARSRDVLAKLCPLDLDPVVFGPDAVALTKFSQVAVQLWRAGNADSFDVVFPRSYSRYLWRALLEASAE
jgi:heterotetrameric sarcosine oxidase gamma subunit